MHDYVIKIGEAFDLEKGQKTSKQRIYITSAQLEIIELFASQRKDSDLNTIYKLNDCEFTINPWIRPDVNIAENLKESIEHKKAKI